MSTKKTNIDGLGEVTIYKRRGARNVRLSVMSGNHIRITIPPWAPFKVGVDFAESKRDWIQSQLKPIPKLQDKQQIGKAHHLQFVATTSSTPTSRVSGTQIVVGVPAHMTPDDIMVQAKAEKAAIRALKAEAEQLLPQRLHDLAAKYGFEYRSVKIKQLKGRWGSCSQHKDIVLNCFLMQLPWQLIDYVILHELVHTQIMAHGKPFWDELAHYVPKLTAIRKTIKAYHPNL